MFAVSGVGVLDQNILLLVETFLNTLCLFVFFKTNYAFHKEFAL